ncbi:MAG: hypothetical protein QOD39_4250 [Mycobacterium sp.]|nr:hypothetical protein [Mycobacterium sp.]
MAATVALTGIAGSGTAHAQPPPPGTLCNYNLSPPQVINVSGTDMVTATLAPAGCAGAFRPYASVACVQLQGDQATKCSQARGADIAQVFFGPYQPGATYISTGRGLGTLFNDMSEPNWQMLGPIAATL